MQKNVEKMSVNYSPNFNTKKRSRSKIKYLIYHYTGMKSESAAIKRLTNLNSKVSCHYFIKFNGEIVRIVPDLYVAWHAGISSWKKDTSLNSNSIGVEISKNKAPDVMKLCLEKGLLVNAVRPNTLRLFPPLNVTEGDINKAIEILEEAFVELKI